MLILPELLADTMRRERERELSLAVEHRRLALLLRAAGRCCRATISSRLRGVLRGPVACSACA